MNLTCSCWLFVAFTSLIGIEYSRRLAPVYCRIPSCPFAFDACIYGHSTWFFFSSSSSSFLPRIADSLVSLLESGADREPEIIEQVQFILRIVI